MIILGRRCATQGDNGGNGPTSSRYCDPSRNFYGTVRPALGCPEGAYEISLVSGLVLEHSTDRQTYEFDGACPTDPQQEKLASNVG